MSKHLLSEALGSYLADFDGLREVELPVELEIQEAISIAQAANERRSGDIPHAIVVSDLSYDEKFETKIISPNDAIAFRMGDRLSIRADGSPQPTSSASSFVQLMSQAFPSSGSYAFELDKLAATVLETLLLKASIDPVMHRSRGLDIARLVQIMTLLIEAYENFEDGRRPWNVLWYEHINTGLENLLTVLEDSPVDKNLGDLFEESTYAAFSLPRPDSGTEYAKRNSSGRAIRDALAVYWNSEVASLETLLIISRQKASSFDLAQMQLLNWSELDTLETSSGSLLRAWSRFSQEHKSTRTQAFSKLSESDFFSPMGNDFEDIGLRFESSEGESLMVPMSFIFVIETESAPALDPPAVRSQDLRIVIPLLSSPTSEEVRASKLIIKHSAKNVRFVGDLHINEETLEARGNFELTHESGDSQFPIRMSKVYIELDSGDSLSGYVPPGSEASGFFVPPTGFGCIAFPRSGVKYLKPISVSELTSNEFGAPDDGPKTVECVLNKPGEHLLICWGASNNEIAQIRDRPLARRPGSIQGSSRLFEDTVVLGNDDRLNLGENGIEFILKSSEASKSAVQTPIQAAIDKAVPSNDPPEASVRDSIRGAAEEYLLELIDSDNWRRSLGHLAVPQDGATSLESMEASECGAYFVPRNFLSPLRHNTNFKIPSELLNSEEADLFRSAFDLLEVKDALSYELPDSDESRLRLISSTSWRHLWVEQSALQKYLVTYANLVKRAKTLKIPSSAGVFWATFPFSISSWDAHSVPFRCESVLLSPLHPIRLAWLSATESTLYNSTLADKLAGTIEGWNFPLLAPSESAGGRLISIPTDSGPQQLFLGWSMMVSAPVGAASQIKAPEHIGIYRSPGASSGGLNGASVAGAIKEYKRMNSYASTITIDLAAVSPTNRTSDVDEAVVGAMRSWFSNGREVNFGGVRVNDSLNRRGEPPRDKLIEILGEDTQVPLTWSRYDPRKNQKERSNLRLLQDAGVAINVLTNGSSLNCGVVTNIPLKRFEARDPRIVDGTGSSKPVIDPEFGWQPLTAALFAIEDGAQGPSIQSQMQGGAISDGNADWTIAGETMVSPASLAALMRANKGSTQMLWEWKPPFLDRTPDALNLIDRRPYLSIVRVPSSFKNKVEVKLESALKRAVTAGDIDNLLSTLGARGVGLASLVSMGGTHATGALGFYAALKLMDQSESSQGHRFVLPIDACDEFLWALSSEELERTSRKRADLLLIELQANRVILAPLEIKYWGLEAEIPEETLPKIGSSKVKEALEQANLTHSLLAAVCDRSNEFIEESADRQLWYSAFGSLIESAIRLHPGHARDQHALTKQLQDLVAGNSRVEVAPPLILILQQDAKTNEGHSYYSFNTPRSEAKREGEQFGALVADPTLVFSSLEDGSSKVVDAWKEVVNWAFDSGSIDGKDSASTTAETLVEPSNEGSRKVEKRTRTTEYVQPQPLEDDPNRVEGIIGNGVRFKVGDFIETVGESAADFWPGNTKLNQMNVGIVGDLGTGKTQLLMALIAKLRVTAAETQPNPLSMLIFDYKSDFQSEGFLDSVGGKVIRPFGIHLNIFQLEEKNQNAAYQRARSFVNVLTKIYGGIGQVQSNNLTEVILELYSSKNYDPPTLKQVRDGYRDRLNNGDSVVGVLNNFVLGGIFSDDPQSLIPFDQLIEDRVSVLALNQLGADDSTKNALVVLFLNQYYEYMLKQTKWNFQGSDPQLRRLNSFLIVDEAQNIMKFNFPVLETLLLQGREFGTGIILSSQYLTHFKTSEYNYGETLRTWFIHKVPNVSAKELNALGLPSATSSDATAIQSLQIHQAFYSSLDVSGRFIKGEPFYEYLNQINA